MKCLKCGNDFDGMVCPICEKMSEDALNENVSDSNNMNVSDSVIVSNNNTNDNINNDINVDNEENKFITKNSQKLDYANSYDDNSLGYGGISNKGIYFPEGKDVDAAKLEEEKKEMSYLLKTLIGKKQKVFLERRFNICAFLFSGFYFAYRKLLSVAFIICILNFAIIFSFCYNPLILFVVNIILGIILGFVFNSIYIEDSIDKIKKYKEKNQNKAFNELSDIISNTSPTSFLNIIITIVFYVLIMFIGFMAIKNLLPDYYSFITDKLSSYYNYFM